MRIAVISDTHGRRAPLDRFLSQRTGADLFLHLGDGWEEFRVAKKENPKLSLMFVKGNNDFSCPEPEDRLFEFAGKTVFATHGHRHGVKYGGVEGLLALAKETGADIVLFGHTHTPFCEYRDGVYFLNPGSPTFPNMSKASSGVVDVTDAGIVCFVSPL